MQNRKFPIELEEQYIHCDQLNTISSFNDKILFNKHTGKINHIDLKKNLLMTSGDDDLIIIVDLKIVKYVRILYDIINGTKFSKFLEPLSTRIIYYGYKSFKLFVYDFLREEILIVVNLLKTKLSHFEFNNKSNIIITTQEKDSIIWKLEEKKINPEYNIKNSYYSIINDNKQNIISCARNVNELNKIYNVISIYKYEIINNLIVVKERDLIINFEGEIKLMNYFKNLEQYFLILMSEFSIEIIDLENNGKKISTINLIQNKDLKFTYFEPVFTKEIIIGYNKGEIELLNPLKNNKNINLEIEKKYSKDKQIEKLIRDTARNEINHESSVVQIKISDYYPLYVSISDEMIIHQRKND